MAQAVNRQEPTARWMNERPKHAFLRSDSEIKVNSESDE
jgi:hypothetical protein